MNDDRVRAGQTENPSTRSSVVRPGAEEWDITSRLTGRSYRIFVARPVETQAPPKAYPVIYLTDADYHFHTAADAVTLQTKGLELGPAYVVGVGYGRGLDFATRSRCADLTPTPPDPATRAALEAAPLTEGAPWGEAELFHRFLTEELRPRIEADYPVDHDTASLWGHSFGGLFVLHVLFNHPGAYRTFLANSPSINWNGGAVLKDEVRLQGPSAGEAAPRVLLTAGEYEETLADHVELPPGVSREDMQAMLTSFGMVTNVLALADRLRTLDAPPCRKVEAVIFQGETHLSVIPAAISRGLRFALAPDAFPKTLHQKSP